MNPETQSQRDQHLSVARHLAREIGAPESTVIEVYERELETLRVDARITQFLDLLTSKRVKAALRPRASESR
jgi:hypothetical protein